MARPNLGRHRKFALLSRKLGSEPLARGTLELIWDSAYENGDDLVGSGAEVEAVARWAGENGTLAPLLAEVGFLDRDGEMYRVHDLYDHAPEYVRKRFDREEARRASGRTLQEIRSAAARTAAQARWGKDASRMPRGITSMPHGTTPAPAPAPAPAQEEVPLASLAGSLVEDSSSPRRGSTGPAPEPSLPKKGAKTTDPRVKAWTAALVADYQTARGEPYAHGGAKDTEGVKRLITASGGDLAVAEVRWRRGLALGSKFPGVATLAALAARWNDLAADPGRNGTPPHRDGWESDSPKGPQGWVKPTDEQIAEWEREERERLARAHK